MSEKYGEIMEQVKVTAEMRARILANLRAAETDAPARPLRFPQARRLAALAACLAVVLGGLLLWRSMNREPDGDTAVVSPVTDCASAAELSAALGFDIGDATSLPFTPVSSVYTALDGKVGQISYTGAAGETALYRKSRGTEDNSGDYNSYPDRAAAAVGGAQAELRGTDGVYVLAVWTDGTYACSLSLTPGLSAGQWSAVLAALD